METDNSRYQASADEIEKLDSQFNTINKLLDGTSGLSISSMEAKGWAYARLKDNFIYDEYAEDFIAAVKKNGCAHIWVAPTKQIHEQHVGFGDVFRLPVSENALVDLQNSERVFSEGENGSRLLTPAFVQIVLFTDPLDFLLYRSMDSDDDTIVAGSLDFVERVSRRWPLLNTRRSEMSDA